MKNYFKNKVVIITGSNLGIGKSTAIELAKLGAKIVLNGRTIERLITTQKEIEAINTEVLAIPADITSYDDCIKLMEETVKRFKQVDILINNAGVSMRGNFEEVEPSVFKQVMDVNYMGTINATKAALPYLKISKGQFMLISSVAGIRGLQGVSAYCAAKMALTSIAESLKIELNGIGITTGITYVGFTQNDPIKKTIAANGKLIPIEARNEKNAQTTTQVANAILRSIRRKKFKTVLTPIGKLNAVANKIFPCFVSRLLIMADKKIKRMSK